MATRRIETDIELGEGQSFVIAGLLDDRVTENLSQVPGLSHLPILGALFKSRSETKAKTELLVMVTPESIYPLLPTDPKPMPVMPKEFLPGIKPKNVPGKAPHGEDPAEKPAAAIEARPTGPAPAVVPMLPGGTMPVEAAQPAAIPPEAPQEKAAAGEQPAAPAEVAPDAGTGIDRPPDASPVEPAPAPDTAARAAEVKPTTDGASKPQAEAPGH